MAVFVKVQGNHREKNFGKMQERRSKKYNTFGRLGLQAPYSLRIVSEIEWIRSQIETEEGRHPFYCGDPNFALVKN